MDPNNFEHYRRKALDERANVPGVWYLVPVGYVFAAVVAFMVLAEAPDLSPGPQAGQPGEPVASLSPAPAGADDAAFTGAALIPRAYAADDGVQAP